MLQADEILFLLGAGASANAGIPVSTKMVEKIEMLLKQENEWKDYQNLYFYLKSSIAFRYGINGDFSANIINIETLVNTMDELLKSYDHPVYPFVGSWIPRLTELAGKDFENIKKLRKKIITELSTKWMECTHKEDSDYYKKLNDFQKIYAHELHIFSLNYDLCIENQCKDMGINRGFDDHIWSWKNFENQDKDSYNVYLYKLHGSIDWAKNIYGTIEERDNQISDDELAIIFGTSYKLQYIDPFLYLIYEFRRRTLDNRTKALICIGYSFNDDHINGIIGQSLKDNSNRHIIAIYPHENEQEQQKYYIRSKIDIQSVENIHIENKEAKDYLENTLSVESIEKHLSSEESPF